jgi:hypothetical protein
MTREHNGLVNCFCLFLVFRPIREMFRVYLPRQIKPQFIVWVFLKISSGWQIEAGPGRAGPGLAVVQCPTRPGRARPPKKLIPDGRAWSGLGLGSALSAALFGSVGYGGMRRLPR